ncbi:erythromycin esterase family protein [Pedobacter nototheniae]|uniref:erythromycin esterase family protein n=1 Tax=Pedobacter nototheniae TaxID=2488994 RepID=UPI0013F47F14|nr:erythromycin esterase family protein [Pedobacter nototheniae]
MSFCLDLYINLKPIVDMKIKTTIAVALLSGFLNLASAQNKDALKPVSMENFASFKQSVKPLIDKMGVKKIVGLGEGTHGTAEFYKLRYWITKVLVEEKGFNYIAFENDYSDCWMLNKELNAGGDLNILMKKYLLSIWQNEETKELLNWVKTYNSKHKNKVTIAGVDYVYLLPDIKMLQTLLSSHPDLLKTITLLKTPAAYQDEAWEGMNSKTYKFNGDSLNKSGYAGYLLAEKLDQEIEKSHLTESLKNECHISVTNIKQAFAPFYHYVAKTDEVSRDVNMANTASMLLQNKNDKLIIWAHEAHLAKKPVYDGEVGGMGGELLKKFPDNYFVLATGTAIGTFAATEQSRDTYTNPMKAYPLEKPIANSWEEQFSNTGMPTFYFYPPAYNIKNDTKPFRIIGYTPKSGPDTYDKTNMIDHFDAYLFLKDTQAATPLK